MSTQLYDSRDKAVHLTTNTCQMRQESFTFHTSIGRTTVQPGTSNWSVSQQQNVMYLYRYWVLKPVVYCLSFICSLFNDADSNSDYMIGW